LGLGDATNLRRAKLQSRNRTPLTEDVQAQASFAPKTIRLLLAQLLREKNGSWAPFATWSKSN
jgi:hypothetical protein